MTAGRVSTLGTAETELSGGRHRATLSAARGADHVMPPPGAFVWAPLGEADLADLVTLAAAVLDADGGPPLAA